MEGILHTLIVEDSEDDALLLVHQLTQGGYELDWRRVDTPADLNAALSAQAWDIIFADHSMPHFSGPAALALVRERGVDTPFIFLSGTIGEDTAVEAMRAGAQDYIMKGNRKRLLPAVERELRDAQLQRERLRANRELHMLATVTQAAAEATDMLAALSVSLTSVCEATDWQLAQAWIPRADGVSIECSPAWCCRDSGLEIFRTASLSFAFAPGQGLPGRVWSSKQPEWLHDLPGVANFERALFAAKTGLTTAMGIPVLAGGEVIAVLEFFTRAQHAEDARLVQLISTVASQLGVVIQRKRSEERLHYLAHYDSLTGLPNRVLFTDRLRRAILEANRHHRLVGVAFLDLDRFKTINDSLGHGIGDLFLRSVAERLGRFVREGDTVARLAGDEFTLIFADMAQIEDAGRVARKILDSLTQPFLIAGHELFTSASLGITIYPDDDSGVEGLLRNADIAMYRAKEAGGNGYAFYSADMTARAQERLALENDLRRALDHGEFSMYYQPLADLQSCTITGVEALARWQHPRRGLIPPAEFIPLAEETGLIVRLGEWALRTACEQRRDDHVDGVPLRVAVNVSARQFQQPDFVKNVVRVLDDTKFDPRRLEIEITESLLMQNAETAVSIMRDLGDLGIRFSVDDFGTGYSSLAYLKHLPIARLKIDKSFVRDVPADANDVAIVSAIIAMGHNLGLNVIAEGVETLEQLELLRAHGCDAAQGFYFSRPITNKDFAARLGASAQLPWRAA